MSVKRIVKLIAERMKTLKRSRAELAESKRRRQSVRVAASCCEDIAAVCRFGHIPGDAGVVTGR
jgi:hypothetical protein